MMADSNKISTDGLTKPLSYGQQRAIEQQRRNQDEAPAMASTRTDTSAKAVRRTYGSGDIPR